MSQIQRIISLVPSSTEILYYLGLETLVVGVTEHCNFPEEVKYKEKIGTFAQPRVSSILSLKPDMVVADSAVHGKIIGELKNTGIKVLASAPSNLEAVFYLMSEIGRLCGIENTAGPVIDSLRERVLMLGQKSIYKRPRVYLLMSANPFITPGHGSFQYDALQTAGAELMNFDSNNSYVRLHWEQIKKFDPEVILFCGVEKGQEPPPRCKGCAAGKPLCRRTPEDFITGEWGQITAVRTNRLYPVSCDTICRPGPRLIDGMERLHSRYLYTY
ncbi:vitamin B12 ABC transporter [Desulfocucumis palustris]|uniref:Vitamin B12 ABC transporter n=1 Tax=Desulfocucumis palustris TaxID=1898651 RepID=A0A2L2X8N3_9FIRM|nr:helical backbone metal receptor [Desulfocucumis palustris]GBF32370.1 vitamin B12 ABC transporter [Desulfocucumis palustris]